MKKLKCIFTGVLLEFFPMHHALWLDSSPGGCCSWEQLFLSVLGEKMLSVWPTEVTWDFSCLHKNAEGFLLWSWSFQKQTTGWKLNSSFYWCGTLRRKKWSKGTVLLEKQIFWYMENTLKPTRSVPCICSYGNSYVKLHKVTWQRKHRPVLYLPVFSSFVLQLHDFAVLASVWWVTLA